MEILSRDTLRLLENPDFREAVHQVLELGGTRTVNGLTVGRITFAPKETAAEMQARTVKELANLTRDSRTIDAVGKPADARPDSPARKNNCSRCNELEAARDHLRARLRELVERWHGHASTASWRCAADLLAVLTQLEEKKDD